MGWGSGPQIMVEEAELEEGEAYDDTSIDPETAFSYLDDKVQSVLGHFQKDFEGGVSAENLGAKFGGYGSFLPTYQRSPSIWSQPKSPQRVQTHSTRRSPNYLHREGAAQNGTGLPDAPFPQRNGTSVNSGVRLSDEMMVRDCSIRQDSCLSSAQVAGKFPPRRSSPNKSFNLSDQKTLKFRIKVGSDKTTTKNAAIYSGLGLTSPSSSMGNSPVESGGKPFVSQETSDDSLSCILQMLTSFAVAGGLLVSPLHDKFVKLISNNSMESKPGATVKFKHDNYSTSADDSASRLVDEDVLIRKQIEAVGKSDKDKQSSCGNRLASEDDTLSLLKDNCGAETLQNKQCVSFDTTKNRLPGSVANTGESLRESKAPETFNEHEIGVLLRKREVTKDKANFSNKKTKDKAKSRLLGTELIKDESFEAIPGRSGAKFEHRETKSSSLELIRTNQIKSVHKDVPVDHSEGLRSKANRTAVPFKADSDISEEGRDPKGDIDHLMQEASMRAASQEQDELRMPEAAKKLSTESKRKLKGSQVKGKLSLDSTQESRGAGVSGAMKENAIKRDVNKVRDIYKDLFETSEPRSKPVDLLENPSGSGLKKSNFENVKEKHAHADTLKEKPSCNKFDHQMASRTSLKDPPPDSLPSNNGLTMATEQATVAPVLIEEDWVCCDRCQKWRLLPYGTKPEHLPEKWLCSMLNWLPGMNRCDISEEETTKALHALYQLSVTENQHGIQNHADRPTIGLHSVDKHFLNQNRQNVSFDYMAHGRKKNHRLKETFVTGSKPKNFQQDVVKRATSKDMKQPFLGADANNKSSGQHLDKTEIAAKEHSNRQKQEHVTGADAKPKRRGKRDSDQHEHGIVKKIKTEGAFDMSNFQASAVNLGSLALCSNTISPTMSSVKDNRKHGACDYSKDGKSEERNGLQTPARKPREEASVLISSGSLDMMIKSNNKEISSKKRKLTDWQNSQNYAEILQSDGSHLGDRNMPVKEESSDSGFRRDKKPLVSQTDGKESSRSKSNLELKRKNSKTRMLPSACDNTIDLNLDRPKQLNKYRVKITSQLTMEDLESLKKDLGCEPVSTTATSSSSKVSDSRKTRKNYQEVKGSPVESVSSSPMRMSNPNKLSPTRMDGWGLDDAKVGDFSRKGSPRKFVDWEVNYVTKRSGMGKKRKESDVRNPKSVDNPVDFWEIDAREKFGGESKVGVKPSLLFGNGHLDHTHLKSLEGHSPCPTDMCASEPCYSKDRPGKNQQKSGKASSLLPKDKGRSLGLKPEGALEKVSDLPNDQGFLNTKRSSRLETEIDQSGVKSVKANKNTVKWESRKFLDGSRENQSQSEEHERSGVKLGGRCSKDASAHMQKDLIKDFDSHAVKNISTLQDCRNRKSLVDWHPEDKHEVLPSASKLAPGTENGILLNVRTHDASICGDVPKMSKDLGNVIHRNEPRHIIGNCAPDRTVVRDLSVPSIVRRDASGLTASTALKEAENLREYADHLKTSGFVFECNEAYFQAALKFLHGAYLLESNNKPGEMNQMQIYISTAKLCETCAREYERRQEMAAAALAYKCMEVAYMRVIYCKNSSTNRLWHDLQASLQPQGESPSSSASDIDNLNNQALVDKSKSKGSHLGNHVIAPRNRPSFVRLLDFANDVTSAMEASRKCQNASAAANVILEVAQNKEGVDAVKKVIDFSFQDVEELVRLLRIAIQAISRQGFSGCRD